MKRTQAANPCTCDGEAVRRSGRPLPSRDRVAAAPGGPGMAPPGRTPDGSGRERPVTGRERYKRPFDVALVALAPPGPMPGRTPGRDR